jgi:hypothetical protein
MLFWWFEFGWTIFSDHSKVTVPHQCQHCIECYNANDELSCPTKMRNIERDVHPIKLCTEYCNNQHQWQKSQRPRQCIDYQSRTKSMTKNNRIENADEKVVNCVSQHWKWLRYVDDHSDRNLQKCKNKQIILHIRFTFIVLFAFLISCTHTLYYNTLLKNLIINIRMSYQVILIRIIVTESALIFWRNRIFLQ